MKPSLVSSVRCAKCGGELWLRDPVMDEGEIVTGSLDCAACSSHCPIVGGIPRFVPADNYAASFGFQWNQFRQTQLDSYTGRSVSRDRFLNATGWQPESLAGKTVLDAGCGAGRFAEVALSYGATVFAVDYSCAVEACRANFPAHPNLHVVQGNIYSLPFPKDFFDDIYCLGVLQHTPDPRRAFLALPRHLKPGGRIAVDIYHGGWRRGAQREILAATGDGPLTSRAAVSGGRAKYAVADGLEPGRKPHPGGGSSRPADLARRQLRRNVRSQSPPVAGVGRARHV
jgi:SAM-dependent methyltransferase